MQTSQASPTALPTAGSSFVYQSSDDQVVQAFVDDLRFAIEDIKRLNARIKAEPKLRPMVRRVAPALLDLCGVSTIAAAGHAGDLAIAATRMPSRCAQGPRR